MVRHIFGIFLTRRPISANILRDDEFEGPADIAVGQERRGKVGKNSWEEGKILKTGTKTSLLKVKVLPSGELLEGPAADSYTGRVLGTRAKERALLKAAANPMPARTARLQEINSSILDDTLEPVPAPICRLPKKRPADNMQALQAAVTDLACFSAEKTGPGATEIAIGTSVYVNGAYLLFATEQYRQDPDELFRTLMRHCLTPDLTKTAGLTVTGARGTVEVPKQLQAAVLSYVQLNAGKLRGKATDVLRNFLWSAQHPKKRVVVPEQQDKEPPLQRDGGRSDDVPEDLQEEEEQFVMDGSTTPLQEQVQQGQQGTEEGQGRSPQREVHQVHPPAGQGPLPEQAPHELELVAWMSSMQGNERLAGLTIAPNTQSRNMVFTEL
ncbi:hypothetical protein KUF71_010177 [Frankliniella fusca]|uniref:Uncharacterized protein n=1 Tax=Frankliniella fusca TaxID=407009 RepID=A0AAE1LK21_9NEOP|nr:hypothetical protein KUF71_010177 [Frankliniella fusca]